MANIEIWIWVAVIVVSLIGEFISMDVTSIWFACGGTVALILAALNASIEIQVIAFVVISMILILTLRKWARNKLLASEGNTNMDLVIEKRLKLLSSITDTQSGSVKYNGVVWTAVSKNDSMINLGEWVIVKEIKGNKLIVEKDGKK